MNERESALEQPELQCALLAHAEMLADYGLRAFPVNPLTRKPWWTGYKTACEPYPKSYLRQRVSHFKEAKHVGIIVPPLFVVIDIDVKDGKCGDIGLANLEVLLGPLPPTLRQESPSGGWHLIFTLSRAPEPGAFPENFGATAVHGAKHVDVIYRHHRYLTAYEINRIVGKDAADLPKPWEDWLFDNPPGAKRRDNSFPQANGKRSSGMLSLAAEIAALAATTAGSRYITLRDLCLKVVTRRQDTSAVWRNIRRAALQSGLEAGEVDECMMRSAADARARWRDVSAWKLDALQGLRTSIHRRSRALQQTIRALAQQATLMMAQHALADEPSRRLGMSSRELAELCNFSQTTAATCLRRLAELGWLRLDASAEKDSHEANRYLLGWPTCAPRPLNQQPSPYDIDQYTSKQARDSRLNSLGAGLESDSDLLEVQFGQRVLAVQRKNAFARSRGQTATLPKALAPLLVGMEAGPLTYADQVRLIPSRNSRLRYRSILESAGLATYDAASRTLTPQYSDATAALDEYASSMRIPDIAGARAVRHAEESRRFRQAMEAHRDSKQPKSVKATRPD